MLKILFQEITLNLLFKMIFGEKAAVDSYQEALQSGNLCPQSTVVVADQHMQLQASYQKFENLEKLTD